MLTADVLAALQAGYVPGNALPGILDGWAGPAQFGVPQDDDSTEWNDGVLVGLEGHYASIYDPDYNDTVRRDLRRGRVRLPLSRPEVRQRVAVVMGRGERCPCGGKGTERCIGCGYELWERPHGCHSNEDNPCVPSTDRSCCDGSGYLRRPAPARHLLPAAELGDLPDALAAHSSALLACHVARVLAGLRGVRDVLLPWEDRNGGSERVRRCALTNEIRATVGMHGYLWSGSGWDIFGEFNPYGSETGEAGIAKADAACLRTGRALLDSPTDIRLPWPEVSP